MNLAGDKSTFRMSSTTLFTSEAFPELLGWAYIFFFLTIFFFNIYEPASQKPVKN